MSQCPHQAARLAGGLGAVALANAAAVVASVQSQDYSASVMVGWVTAAIMAICGAVVVVSPVIANAIKSFANTVGPALAELQKQRDEIRKGSLSAQVDDLKQSLAENTKRTEDANAKLHSLANESNVAALRHTEEMGLMTRQLEIASDQLREARDEIKALRENEARLLARLTLSQVRQDVQIVENKAAIKSTAEAVERIAGASSGEMPVVKVDPPTPPKGNSDAR